MPSPKKKIAPLVGFLVVTALYFNISYQVPWQKLSFGSTISSSYIFDFLFWVTTMFILKKPAKLGRLRPKGAMLRGVILGFSACIICFTSLSFGLLSPFKYLDQLGIKLLVLAPFFEEIVFRGAFYDYLMKVSIFTQRLRILINALLFSLSHAAALLVLPDEYSLFIYFQLAYTFFLGWFCAKARERSSGILEPIFLHFIFNLIFYLAITEYSL